MLKLSNYRGLTAFGKGVSDEQIEFSESSQLVGAQYRSRSFGVEAQRRFPAEGPKQLGVSKPSILGIRVFHPSAGHDQCPVKIGN
jgi:hypothetical protein